jgi:hypothetical protein
MTINIKYYTRLMHFSDNHNPDIVIVYSSIDKYLINYMLMVYDLLQLRLGIGNIMQNQEKVDRFTQELKYGAKGC